MLRASGAEVVLVDDGRLAGKVGDRLFNKVLDLIGTVTLRDSLQCIRQEEWFVWRALWGTNGR